MVKERCWTPEKSDSDASTGVIFGKGKKRRFSEAQVKSLERIFETETTRLDPRKKVQVARELGLHRRQVAIWFQNRRARWKAKRVEKDYCELRADYDSLVARFESLKQEKRALLEELQRLTGLGRKKEDSCSVQSRSNCEPKLPASLEYMDVVNGDKEPETLVKQEFGFRSVSSSESFDGGTRRRYAADGGTRRRCAAEVDGGEAGEDEDGEEIGLRDHKDGSLCLPKRSPGFNPTCCPDQSSSQWWDLWL